MITVTCLTSDIGHHWIFDLAVKTTGTRERTAVWLAEAQGIASAASGDGMPRFIQNRSPTTVAALKSDAAAEKSKDQLSRDF